MTYRVAAYFSIDGVALDINQITRYDNIRQNDNKAEQGVE